MQLAKIYILKHIVHLPRGPGDMDAEGQALNAAKRFEAIGQSPNKLLFKTKLKMKHFKFLQITGFMIALFMMGGVQSVNAQCSLSSSYPGAFPTSTNGVNVSVGFSSTGGNPSIVSTAGQPAGCGFTYPAVIPFTGNQGANGAITFTFSVPVNNVSLLLAGFGILGQADVETVNITTNGGTPTLTSIPALCTGGTISGNSYSADNNNTTGIVQVSAPSGFTTLTVTQPNPNGSNGGIASSVCLSSIAPAPTCNAGTVAPTF